MQLSNQYPQYVTPLLESTFKQVAGKCDPPSIYCKSIHVPRAQSSVDLQSVVQKEALYCALGRCAIRLKDVIPFNQWLEHTLSVEAQDTNPKCVFNMILSTT